MKQFIPILILFFSVFISCNKNDVVIDTTIDNDESVFISAVDISKYPEIAKSNQVFYDGKGNQNDFLKILNQNGVNTIRLRLWVNPTDTYSSFTEVKSFSKQLKDKGFKIWITLHYSDAWADPKHQKIPKKWSEMNFEELKNQVYTYTQKVVSELQPDYIQIGNEINDGFLHPYGQITKQYQNFKELIGLGTKAVRDFSNNTKIILHFAGIKNSDWFFSKVNTVDYDIIGLSYYPIWHGKSLQDVENQMKNLSEKYHKKIIIAETAYPFTLKWNDLTNNIVGENRQLILPEYPATPQGQRKFIKQIVKITNTVKNGIGFCYWGAELISWKGKQSTNASVWENQALFDFNNKALPVLTEFNVRKIKAN